jgi:hypothetical protein
VVVPDALITQSYVDRRIGRAVLIEVVGGDITVFDPREKLRFTGGLYSRDRVPDLRDGLLPQWQAALSGLVKSPTRQIIPGHGAAVDLAHVKQLSQYWQSLSELVNAHLAQGSSLAEFMQLADLPAYQHWQGYAENHKRNASTQFVRAEKEQF